MNEAGGIDQALRSGKERAKAVMDPIERNPRLILRHLQARADRFCRLVQGFGIIAGGGVLLVVLWMFLRSLMTHSLKVDGLWPTVSGGVAGLMITASFWHYARYSRNWTEALIQEGKVVHARLKPDQLDVFEPLYQPLLTVAEKTLLRPFLKYLPMETVDYELEVSGQKMRHQDHLFNDEVLYEDEDGTILVFVPSKGPEDTAYVITRRGPLQGSNPN